MNIKAIIRDLFYSNTLHDGEWYGKRYVFDYENVYGINSDDSTLRNVIVMKSDDNVNAILALKETFREIGYNYTKNIVISEINSLQELLKALEKEYDIMKSAIMADQDLVLMQDSGYETPRDGVLFKSQEFHCSYSEETEKVYVGGADGYWIQL